MQSIQQPFHKGPSAEKVLEKLSEIETEMKQIGLWQNEALMSEQYQFHQAFAMDTMSFSQWLQFVFIPKVKEAAKASQFPAKSQVGAQAVREFDTLPAASRLVTLLSEFDALF
jgi:uncharacterized protein YqcC (DUF446 family)